MMKAILIDPYKTEVTLVDHTGQLESIYALIQCDNITSVTTIGNDFMYADDESWLKVKDDDTLAGFYMEGWTYAILGRALVVGIGEEGYDAEVNQQDLQVWKKHINWVGHDLMRKQGEIMGVI